MTPYPDFAPCQCGSSEQTIVSGTLKCAGCGVVLVIDVTTPPLDTFRGYTVDLVSALEPAELGIERPDYKSLDETTRQK